MNVKLIIQKLSAVIIEAAFSEIIDLNTYTLMHFLLLQLADYEILLVNQIAAAGRPWAVKKLTLLWTNLTQNCDCG